MYESERNQSTWHKAQRQNAWLQIAMYENTRKSVNMTQITTSKCVTSDNNARVCEIRQYDVRKHDVKMYDFRPHRVRVNEITLAWHQKTRHQNAWRQPATYEKTRISQHDTIHDTKCTTSDCKLWENTKSINIWHKTRRRNARLQTAMYENTRISQHDTKRDIKIRDFRPQCESMRHQAAWRQKARHQNAYLRRHRESTRNHFSMTSETTMHQNALL